MIMQLVSSFPTRPDNLNPSEHLIHLEALKNPDAWSVAQLKQNVLGYNSNRYILKYYNPTVQPRSRTTRFKHLEEQMTSKWWLVPAEYVAGFYFILLVFLNLVQSTKF